MLRSEQKIQSKIEKRSRGSFKHYTDPFQGIFKDWHRDGKSPKGSRISAKQALLCGIHCHENNLPRKRCRLHWQV